MGRVGGALLALALVAAPAQAQGNPFRSAAYRVKLSGGTLRLEFHGDKATGCGRRGLCGTTGTVTTVFKPRRSGGSGSLLAAHGIAFGVAGMFVNGITRAVVQSPGSAACRDDAARDLATFSLGARPKQPARIFLGGGALESIGANGGTSFGLAGDDIFGTRCAGPSIEDLAPAMPRAFVKRSWLAGQAFTVRLSRVRTFRGGGFAGIVTSNLQLTFHRLGCARPARQCRSFDAAVTNSA